MPPDARHRIQAVAAMTGVPAATLRAWERRYGVPAPRRTSSAYRLYSDHDVEQVRRMGALVAAGVPPSEAARRLSGLDVIDAPRGDDAFDDMIGRITAAVRVFDAVALRGELRRLALLDDGHVAFARVLGPALARIGSSWEAGEISVANEHFASHLIASTIGELLRTAAIPADAATVLLACVADEEHTLPLLGAALAVVAWGYRPLILGARTPAGALTSAVASVSPAIVGLSVTIPPATSSAARRLVDEYAAACGDTPWIVGGAGAAALAAPIATRGGHVVPSQPAEARALLGRLAMGAVHRDERRLRD